MVNDRKRKRWYLSPGIIGSAVVIPLALAWFLFAEGGLWQTLALMQTRSHQDQQIELRQAQKRLREEYLAALKRGDMEALERAARELELVSPNELVYEVQVVPAPK